MGNSEVGHMNIGAGRRVVQDQVRINESIESGTFFSNSTILQTIEPFGLPMKLVHLVLVNGVFVPPEERATRQLADGDVLAIWPPIAGG